MIKCDGCGSKKVVEVLNGDHFCKACYEASLQYDRNYERLADAVKAVVSLWKADPSTKEMHRDIDELLEMIGTEILESESMENEEDEQ